MHEYELQAAAEYVFRKHGAQGAAYFALVGDRQEHDLLALSPRHGEAADGDLVQFDYAPDYKYYVSDVTRVFPANGQFTPWQREYYTHLSAAVSGADDVHQAARAVTRDHR